MALDPDISRKSYYDFMSSAMTWLLRQEFRQPISLQSLSFQLEENGTAFKALVNGPAVNYLSDENLWQASLCGQDLSFDQLLFSKLGERSWQISGRIPSVLNGGTICTLEMSGVHSSFGSVKSRISGQVPAEYGDETAPFSEMALRNLEKLTGARLHMRPSAARSELSQWLGEVTGAMGVTEPNEKKSISDFYWVFETWWVYILLLALPLEVLVRRWPHITNLKKV